MLIRNKIAITMGDPAGIGAEVIIKALSKEDIYEKCIPIVIGDKCVLQNNIEICNSNLKINLIENTSDAKGEFGTIDCIDLKLISLDDFVYGKSQAICGKAAFQYIIYAINLAMSKEVEAVVTAPINKEALNLAGYEYSGHTEIFAEYTQTKDFAMLLATNNLRVIHVTTHCALRDVSSYIKKERVLKVIKLAEKGAKLLGIEKPKIGVAGLNPHCSENGLFGSEESEEIIPAIKSAQELGIDVDGPESPDVVFVKCISGKYDIIVAMYHDQGHIPLKLNGFKYNLDTNKYEAVSGINCTIGLPIIRTSVDHGTAFGKAGKGLANEESMIDAIWAAIKMSQNSY